MSAQDDDRPAGALWQALSGLALLAVILAVGLSIGHARQRDAAPRTPAPLAVAMPAASAAPADGGDAGDKARVEEENGVVKFTFARASAALAPHAQEALGIVVKGVAAGQKAVINGLGDAGGDPAGEQELTRQRVHAVHDALTGLGIGDDKIVEQAGPEAAASSAGAARVEVRLE